MRSLHDPQGRWAWQEERLRCLGQHWPLGGSCNPTQRMAHYPEYPNSDPDPRALSTDIQTQTRSFPGWRPGPVPTQVSTSSCTQNMVRGQDSHCRKQAVLSKHNQCRQDWKVKVFILHTCLSVTTWIVALQSLLSMGFCRQEYWIQLPFPSPGDLPNPEMNPVILHACRLCTI